MREVIFVEREREIALNTHRLQSVVSHLSRFFGATLFYLQMSSEILQLSSFSFFAHLQIKYLIVMLLKY